MIANSARSALAASPTSESPSAFAGQVSLALHVTRTLSASGHSRVLQCGPKGEQSQWALHWNCTNGIRDHSH